MLTLVHGTVTLQKHDQQPLNHLKRIDPLHHLSVHEKSGNYRYGNRGELCLTLCDPDRAGPRRSRTTRRA
jgi:hypothetical protein